MNSDGIRIIVFFNVNSCIGMHGWCDWCDSVTDNPNPSCSKNRKLKEKEKKSKIKMKRKIK